MEQGSTNQVNDFVNHASYDVPGYVGEFNDFAYGAGAWQFSTNALQQCRPRLDDVGLQVHRRAHSR